MSTHCWLAQLVSRHRPVNKVLRRRGDVTQQHWNTVPAQQFRAAAMTSHFRECHNILLIFLIFKILNRWDLCLRTSSVKTGDWGAICRALSPGPLCSPPPFLIWFVKHLCCCQVVSPFVVYWGTQCRFFTNHKKNGEIMLPEMYDFIFGGVIIVTWFHKELAQMTKS
jgi:hypothetical protein